MEPAAESSSKLIDEHDDYVELVEETRLIDKLRELIKLVIILSVYAYGFTTMVHLAFWLSDTSFLNEHFINAYTSTSLAGYIYDVFYEDEYWVDENMIKLGLNIGLLIIFGLFHTIFSSRFLKECPTIWNLLKYEIGLEKPLYILFTTLSLHGIIVYWSHVPIRMWTIVWFEYLDIYIWTHILLWFFLYGSILMLDLPDIIGLNSVTIQSPRTIVKSPELQMMIQKQRHMGFLPLLFILLIYPYMTLDRFILICLMVFYCKYHWSSFGCYEYARNMKNLKKRTLFH